MVNYYVWRLHGEESTSSSHDPVERTYDFTSGSFKDLFVDFAEGYMGPDLEGPGSDGERATCADAIEQNPEAVAFFDLLDQEKEALYEGCNSTSSLEATATLWNIKATRNISGVGFDDMCGRFKDWLPADNKLPPSFDASKKKLKRLGLKFEKIHACHNECMLFYKESQNLHECTKCGES